MNDLSLTEFVNRALAIVGHSVYLKSFDEDTPLARQIRNIFQQSMDEAQSEFDWQELVNTITVVPQKDSDSRYYIDIPQDCLNVIKLENQRYYMEGNRIYIPTDSIYRLLPETATNGTWSVKLRYLARSKAVESWSTQLVQACATKLAVDICGFTKPDMRQSLEDRYYRLVLPEAKRIQSYHNSSGVRRRTGTGNFSRIRRYYGQVR